MPLPKEHIFTIDDIYSLPEGERAELIDGQIYMMGAASDAFHGDFRNHPGIHP